MYFLSNSLRFDIAHIFDNAKNVKLFRIIFFSIEDLLLNTYIWRRHKQSLLTAPFKHILFLLLFFAVHSNQIIGQVDVQERLSIYNDTSQNDTIRARAVEDLAWEYIYLNLDTAIYYAKQEVEFVKRIDDQIWTGYAYNTLGVCYFDRGDMKAALDNYLKALIIYERTNSLTDIPSVKNNIGSVYIALEDFDNAEIYFKHAIEISIEINDPKRLAEIYINYGIMLRELKRREEAVEYLLKAKELTTVVDNDFMMSVVLLDLAATYDLLGKDSLSLPLYEEALTISEKIGDIQGQGTVLINLGILQNKKHNYKEAVKYCLKSLEIGKELKVLRHDYYSCMCLTDGYEGLGDYKNSLKYHKIMEEYEDSLLNETNIEEATRLQMNFSFEKERFADSLEITRKEQVKDLKHATDLEKEAKSRLILYGGLGIVLLIAILLVFTVFQKQKDNKLILIKNIEVESQKELVEEKNREIMDSISYAKRIQSAILPPARIVKEYLKNSFILYKPKDIVAGDFYWMEALEPNTILFAAADCTGHGVPGAMVSVVCNNALNRSVREYKLTDPGEILDKTREIVIQEFEKAEENVKDGMDIALCSLKGNTLQYAGAHNPLWIVRNNEVIETKANKEPIGNFDRQNPYTTHTFELQKGDSIFIFSDGYVDQFGGDKGKKFKAKAFRELLLSIQSESMDNQKIRIDYAFENWRGDLEQIDDVCVIGVRI